MTCYTKINRVFATVYPLVSGSATPCFLIEVKTFLVPQCIVNMIYQQGF